MEKHKARGEWADVGDASVISKSGFVKTIVKDAFTSTGFRGFSKNLGTILANGLSHIQPITKAEDLSK
jgi:hypothetical protein